MKTYNYFFVLLINIFLFTNIVKAQNSDEKNNAARIDRLLKSIERKPSYAELKWAIEQTKSFNLTPYIVAGIAFFGIFLQLIFQSRFQSKQTRVQLQKDKVDRLYEALKWFEGGTQKRSIGIAMIEANWQKEEDFYNIWIPVLINQAIYLLLQSEQHKDSHEIFNLQRIMFLLTNDVDLIKREQLKQGFNQLSIAIEKKQDNEGKPFGGINDKGKKILLGLDLSENNLEDLSEWQKIK